ncbi:MAG: DNA-processing protein DprA [Rickettsiales bacterium]
MSVEFDNIFYILKILRTDSITPKIFHNLLNIFKTPKKIVEYLSNFFEKNNSNIKLYDDKLIIKEIDEIKKFGAKIITCLDINYPKILKLTLDHPPILIYYGNINLLKKNCISIVGSRNASIMGMNFTAKISKELSDAGFVVVSGFAKGIDAAAHKAAQNNTIAVMPGGLDYIYPSENTNLYKLISENGLIISEKPLYTKPDKIDFKTRNRIVAGLSLATCIMEASLKSGSLITANLALDYNREIFAVPGNPLDPRSAGTNKLISDGANMLIEVQDILDIISNNNFIQKELNTFQIKEQNYNNQKDLDPKFITDVMRKDILSSLSENPVSIENLHTHFDIEIRYLHLILLELELLGKVKRFKGNKFSLNK